VNRNENIAKLRSGEDWDILVVGGGATGLGIAVDAATRGYKVVLAEKDDFAKGTSSRSTKLLHGGVRYLAQGNVKLVREALRERGILLANAPHLTRRQSFIVPVYTWWEKFYYAVGLGLYDLLAGKLQIGKVSLLSRREVLRKMPHVLEKGLKGGIEYFDGQFDDARLAINLAQTASEFGACMVNYLELEELRKSGKKISGAVLLDRISGERLTLNAKVVINATGVYADRLMGMDDAASPTTVSPSQGVHIVVDRSFFPGESALMMPRTDDERVLFAVPWHDKVVVGTTDTAIEEVRDEPIALEEEIEFIISHFNRYTKANISRKDVRSVFAGLRPLVKASGSASTALISRDHNIFVSNSGLVTIIGGKWTTYRKMAMDAVQNAVFVGKLPKRDCVTEKLRLHGWTDKPSGISELALYGADAERLQSLMQERGMSDRLHPEHPYTHAHVIWAIREEMAVTVEDVLARRTRLLILDARAAVDIAEKVAEVMAAELGETEDWVREQVADFRDLASHYVL
jgi:glycerol-3-phosphate dehydrogenase